MGGAGKNEHVNDTWLVHNSDLMIYYYYDDMIYSGKGRGVKYSTLESQHVMGWTANATQINRNDIALEQRAMRGTLH